MDFNIRQKNLINAKDKNILCLAAAASGKAILDDDFIPTINGLKRVKHIREGEYLIDRLGRPTKVLGIYPQGELPVYKITLSDGREALCSGDHLWATYNDIPKNDEFNTITTLDILNLINKEKVYIPHSNAIEQQEKNFSIDPYSAGRIIGKCYNLELEENERKCFNIKMEESEILSLPSIQYHFGSIKQRIDFIQGIVDSAGSLYKDECHLISCSNITLKNNIENLLFTLGCVPTIITEKIDEGMIKYKISIKIESNKGVQSFLKKRINFRKVLTQHQKIKIEIKKVESLDYKEPMRCFYVDNDEHLFLMKDYIVTHNTRTLVGKIEHILEDTDPKKIVAFTFTNQAAEEMRKRLGDKCKGMFIGTIHSYANYICGLGGINTYDYISAERFDKIIEKALTVSYSKYPAVEYLFVDEFQDTDELQYRFIQKIPAINRFYVGDERQFIYGFRGASDRFIRELATDDNFKKYNLVENYRNPPNIIRFAEAFLNSMPKISPPPISTIQKEGFLDKCSFNDAVEEMTWTDDWTGWAILCRTNSEIEAALEILNREDYKIPNVVVKRGDLDLETMGHLLQENRVKIMTVHAAKGLEFDHVVVVGAKVFNQEERRISYVAATRAMKSLYWCPTIRQYKGKAKKKSHLAGDVFGKTNQKSIQF